MNCRERRLIKMPNGECIAGMCEKANPYKVALL